MIEKRIAMSKTDAGQAQDATSETVLKSLIGPLLIFLLAVYFYILAGNIDEPPSPEQLGAAFWPKMLLIFLMVSCGIKAGEILMARRKGAAEGTPAAPLAEVAPIKLAAMIAMVIAGVYFMDIIGFPLSNFIFLLLFMRIAGVRKKVPLFLTSVLGTIFLLYLFVKIVYLPLPKGQWFFDDMTIFLYRVLHII
jgi:putative tricarboxylic transport membrane protein